MNGIVIFTLIVLLATLVVFLVLLLLSSFSPSRKLFVLAGIGICILAVLGAAPTAIPGVFEGIASWNWDIAEEVRPIRIQVLYGDRAWQSPDREVLIVYEYFVGGKRYRGDRYNVHGNLRVPYSVQPAIDIDFVKTYQVHYNPKNPADSVLVPGIAISRTHGKFVVLFIVGIVLIVWGARLGYYRTERKEEITLKEHGIRYLTTLVCATIMAIVLIFTFTLILGPRPTQYDSRSVVNYYVFHEEMEGDERTYHILGTAFVNGKFPYHEFVEAATINEVGEEVPIRRKTWKYYWGTPGRTDPLSSDAEPHSVFEWTPDGGVQQLGSEAVRETWRNQSVKYLPEHLRPR